VGPIDAQEHVAGASDPQCSVPIFMLSQFASFSFRPVSGAGHLIEFR